MEQRDIRSGVNELDIKRPKGGAAKRTPKPFVFSFPRREAINLEAHAIMGPQDMPENTRMTKDNGVSAVVKPHKAVQSKISFFGPFLSTRAPPGN
jgi:hypothetical protein